MNVKTVSSILFEYGFFWGVSRELYNVKIKMLRLMPRTETFFEKRVDYPGRLDIFDLDVEHLSTFIKGLSQLDQEELIRRADKACEGKLLGFSSIELDYGYPINWQLNPLTKRECDINLKWYQIPDFDIERGDIKVIWESSRFTHFVILARAYMLTENDKYYKAFSEQLDDWLKKNPYSYGANFKCGQECALRMVNALLAYTIFDKYGKVTALDRRNVGFLVLRCYRKILSNFFYAHKCIKNNHTISELVGMIIGAWCCNDEIQLTLAFKTLDKVICEQFTEDGGYKQFSFNYTRLALQDIEVILSIEKKVGRQLNALSRKRIKNAVYLMYQCQNDYGDMPNYGFNDGTMVFPLTSCGYRDFRPVLNTIHALLTGKILYVAGKQDEELIWFSAKSIEGFQRKMVERNSREFKQAGIYTIKNRNAWLMLVLNNYKSRPAHMDQMHIDLWIDNENVLCDSGTFSYASETGQKLALNSSHNTVIYDGKAQMNAYGAFMIYDWTKCEKIKYSRNFFSGKMWSKKGYIHKRDVKVTDWGYEIMDLVKGEEGKAFEVRFHTPCEVLIERESIINLLFNGKIVCTMKFDAPFSIFKSLRSLYYLRSEEINCIVASGLIKAGQGLIKTRIMCKGAL